jgi:hypothetical protein
MDGIFRQYFTELFRLVRLLTWGPSDKGGVMDPGFTAGRVARQAERLRGMGNSSGVGVAGRSVNHAVGTATPALEPSQSAGTSQK